MTDGPESLSAALETALQQFGTMVRSVGWRHRLDEDDLDELLQDVRIRLWRARGESEQIREVTSSYVYRTAVSAALDLLRRRRAGRTEPLDEVEHDLPDGGAAIHGHPEAELAESELAGQVMEVVEGIAPARRPVVRMHLAGYGREEIAALLGWSDAKTRNLLYRGLADLREGLLRRGIGWTSATGDETTPLDRTAIP